MDEFDLRVRRHVYRRFVELGRAPVLEEVARELGAEHGEIERSLRRLHDAHALVLEVREQGAPAIRMALRPPRMGRKVPPGSNLPRARQLSSRP